MIVENGSTDNTALIAHQLCEKYSEVRLVSIEKGNYGEALFQGVALAQGDFIATFDVDLYNFDFFDLAIQMLRDDRVDLVIASKRAAGAHDYRSPLRRLLTFGFAVILRALVDLRVADAHGMKVMRTDRLQRVAASCTMRGSLFDIELVVRAMKAELRVVELPIDVRELRPPRTGIVPRTIESLRGAIHLRSILRSEGRSRM